MESNGFGHFSEDGSEYVITAVDTPMPFVNYVWNDHFLSGISQHLAGIGCFTERPMQYMHPECRSLMIRDENRHFYFRDESSGTIWSPGWYPVLHPLDTYECRHGLGYSTLESSLDGISVRMTVFVPRTEPAEIWKVTVTNESTLPRTVKSYAFADWLLKGYPEYADYMSCLQSINDAGNNLLMCFNEASERPHRFFNGFISSDRQPSGFDSSRRAFLGYGQPDRPAAVVEGRCRNSIGVCEKLVGVLEHTCRLEAGESVTYHVVIGAADTLDTARQICTAILSPGKIDEELQSVTGKIRENYGKIVISTPDAKVNNLFNHWIKRSVQLHTEVGTDTGKGFRDVMQAAWALASFNAVEARKKITNCLRHQFQDGHTLRGWDPVDDHHYSDGPVWIAPAVNAYLKETGDTAFLSSPVPYYNGGEGTVLDHILASLRYASDDTGIHGLVLAHDGDWNDSLNMMGTGGRGESVWTSIGVVYSLKAAMEIVAVLQESDALAKELSLRAEKLTEAVQEHGWDGSWYLQGYNDAGDKIGSAGNLEGRIYLNPQTWAILAGIASPEQVQSMMDAVNSMLKTDFGYLVLAPAYRSADTGIGRLTCFVPGMWENSSSYCHGSAFKIVADTCLGHGDEAYDTMLRILPDSGKNPSLHSGCPPYMVTNMYYGPEHPRKGQILYSWITGTADWLLKAIVGHIIGVRAEHDGLRIAPCVPAAWQNFSIIRKFRGATYQIQFHNPRHRQTGVRSIIIDGQRLYGTLLPLPLGGGTHDVHVVL